MRKAFKLYQTSIRRLIKRGIDIPLMPSHFLSSYVVFALSLRYFEIFAEHFLIGLFLWINVNSVATNVIQ